jgi:hypothetical protein
MLEGVNRMRHRVGCRGLIARAIGLVIVVGLIEVGGAGVARAQNAEAELLFRDGDRLMAAGDFGKACDAFEASNRIEARAGTLIRLGDCREKNNQLASAWSAYSDALSRVKDPKKREIAAARVASLEPRLSQLTISVPDESRVPGLAITRNGVTVDAALWNRGAPVDGGEYVIAGHAPGHEEWSTTVTIAAESGRVSVEVPRFKELQKLAPPPADDRAMFSAGPADDTSMWSGRRKLAAGIAGGGVAFLAGAALLGKNAKGLESDAQALCPVVVCASSDEANDKMETARSRARVANIGYGIAAAAGVAATVLWFTGSPAHTESSSVSLVPAFAPGTAGAIVQGRF